MKKSFARGLVLIIATTLLSSIGQVLLKYGAIHPAKFIFLNLFLWLGLLAYGGGMATLVLGIKEAELSTLFPILSLSFIWVMILSAFLFNEPITTAKIGGTFLIVRGIGILSARKTK